MKAYIKRNKIKIIIVLVLLITIAGVADIMFKGLVYNVVTK